MKTKVILLCGIYCLAVFLAVKCVAIDAALVFLFLSLLFAVRVVCFRSFSLFLVLALACAGLGFARADYLNTATNFVPGEFENRVVYVRGIVEEMQHGEDYARYIIDAERIYTKRQEGDVEGVIRAKLAITVYDIKPGKALYTYGDRIEVRGTFCLPETPDNEGAFDFGIWYKTDGVYGSVVTKQAYTKHIDKAQMPFAPKTAYQIRTYCLDAIQKYVGGDAGALLCGVLLSDRSLMSDALEKNITIAGLNHICVASGLHVSMLYGILIFIFVQLRMRRRFYYPLCSLVLHLFALIVGGGPSITRAVLVFDLCMLAFFTGGDEDRLYTCICAGFIMLLFNPLYLFSVGFLLSFACVFGILLFSKRVEGFLLRYLRIRCVCSLLSVSICAQIFTIPILAANFQALSLYGILYNLLITWLVPFVMIGGILFLLISTFWQYGAQMFAVALRVFLQLICFGVGTARYLPFARVTIAAPDVVRVMFYYATIAAAYCLTFAKKAYLQLCVRIMHVCMLIVTILSVVSSMYCKLSFINVGEGDSALFEMPMGMNLLIDGGGSPAYSKRNLGEETIEPYLRRKGITTIDYAVLSHYDKDHAQGVLHICETMRVRNLILPMRHEKYTAEYKELIEACAQSRGITLHYVQAGDSLALPGGVVLEICNPDAEMTKRKLTENNLSLVFRFKYGENEVLFTGDIEKLAEKKILERNSELGADILKVAHHGSDTSSAAAFVKRVIPTYALISAGDHNVYGHPHNSTLRVLEKSGAEIYNTAVSGDVTFYMQKSGIKWIE